MASQEAVSEQLEAHTAALLAVIEALIGSGAVEPSSMAGLLRKQANVCQASGSPLAFAVLTAFADFADDPDRINGRRLLNDPTQGSA